MRFSCYAIFGGGPHIEWNGKKAELRWRDVFDGTWYQLTTPTDIQWKAFWLLVEQSGVWNWEITYENPHVTDGAGWDFRMEVPGRCIESSGINAYPGSDSLECTLGSPFDVLTTAVGILVGCDVHKLKPPPPRP